MRALVVVALVTLAAPALADRDHCGEERAAIKLGRDATAREVALAPVDTTIAALVALPRPGTPADQRAPAERRVWRVSGTLVARKVETDGDLHLVITDGTRTMIVEIPSATCAAGGAWAEAIATARKAARALRPGAAVVVTGPAFFDYPHHQRGVAPNAIELHPVLSITRL